MFGFPLAFSFPLVLGALAVLPLLYFLLRITPPRPAVVPFPPLRLILGLSPKDETAARTPWWILLLRLAIAACLVFAMAGPVLNPLPGAEAGDGPLLIVLDDGWPAAPSWDRRIAAAARRIEAAARKSQLAIIVATSEGGREITPLDAGQALDRLRALKPVPFVPDRLPVLAAIERYAGTHRKPSIVWIADAVERGHAREFAEKIAGNLGELTILTDRETVRGLAGPQNRTGSLEVRVLRGAPGGDGRGIVRALDLKGLSVGEAPFDFGVANETLARFEMPVELRNEIARLEILGEHSAAAVSLLDERWRRRRVGLVSGETADLAQPLLAPNYYLVKALGPFADMREAKPGTLDPIRSVLQDRVAILILADVGMVPGQAHDDLTRFTEDGGILVRFAGTRLAAASDDLVPVRLRRGGRVLGGSMSWDTPKKLAPFDRQSPFYGLPVPDEVTVARQVLAEPDPGLSSKTWAMLSDGTPLVTAARRGKGLSILFHVTADTTWSNLPLSGLFVDMLRKIVDLSGEGVKGVDAALGAEAKAQQTASIAPNRTLDGFGVLGAPPPSATPIPAGFDDVAGPEHPPGFYGPTDALVAVNTLGPRETVVPADFSGLAYTQESLRESQPVDLKPWLIAAALILFVADCLASLWLSGRLRRPSRRAVAGLSLVIFAALAAPVRPAAAEPAPPAPSAVSPRDLGAALTTRLAYVASGDARVDDVSRQGLVSLSHVLARRTSLTPGDPVGLDPARDELSFYPLLYWPIVATNPQPPRSAIAKAAAYMKQGGTIIFDTRDALTARPGGPPTPEAKWLRQLLEGVDVPELEPIPADHVVTKTFYLLDGFVGRYSTGATWIEALPPAPADGGVRPARAGDSVSPIIITSNDLAAGWASDPDGESLFPLVPGGRRQHEMALRGGVNLVMYTLTGNYKSDQVHVRDLLERLAH
ncbi:LytTR family transcriptional regulator [Beijerinckiaceae bacterium]|nr:LytTR family transcriptional regulator [Beijerinckiaceae bacterium]